MCTVLDRVDDTGPAIAPQLADQPTASHSLAAVAEREVELADKQTSDRVRPSTDHVLAVNGGEPAAPSRGLPLVVNVCSSSFSSADAGVDTSRTTHEQDGLFRIFRLNSQLPAL